MQHVPYYVTLCLEVILGVLLVALVLLHPPKGEGMGGIGGSATLFNSPRTAETGLDRLTNLIAFLFMLICALLGFEIIRP